MRSFVIGDIHGQIKALEQCLDRCNFDFEKDQLICLGDVADRGLNTYECFELLLKVKNLIYILGNHDKWFLEWLENPTEINRHWLLQGGEETLASYQINRAQNISQHRRLLQTAKLYHIDEHNRLFVHGGFELGQTLHELTQNNPMEFYWNRSLWKAAFNQKMVIPFQPDHNSPVFENDIFIGHSNTYRLCPDLKPVRAQNVWNVDQGAAYYGKLTIMNVNSYDYWQSDLISTIV